MDLADKSVGLAYFMMSCQILTEGISDLCAWLYTEVKWEHE